MAGNPIVIGKSTWKDFVTGDKSDDFITFWIAKVLFEVRILTIWDLILLLAPIFSPSDPVL